MILNLKVKRKKMITKIRKSDILTNQSDTSFKKSRSSKNSFYLQSLPVRLKKSKFEQCDGWKENKGSKQGYNCACMGQFHSWYPMLPSAIVSKPNAKFESEEIKPWGFFHCAVNGPNLYPKSLKYIDDEFGLRNNEEIYEKVNNETIDLSEDWLSWFDLIKFGKALLNYLL